MRRDIKSQGFSLIEIMIVLVILGTILTLVAQRVFGAKEKANQKNVKMTMQMLVEQLEMYQGDCNSYPTTSQGLVALEKQPVGEPACESWGPQPYIKAVPKDPWNRAFIYESDGSSFEIISGGKDGPGGQKDYSSKDL